MTILSAFLLDKLRRQHVGMAHAIQRRDLLAWCCAQGVEVTDRKLRYAVKDLGCVCCSAAGYYIPANTDEVKASVAYLKKKIFPLWEDIQALQRAYPECGQLELFR